jgi:prepilin-type N-terminal cleavage/methylation domain-containing protein
MKEQMEPKGFTLIELLLTIALLAISVGVTTDIILSITKSYNKTEMANELEQNANFVLLKMEKELRNAKSITTPSTLNLPSRRLTFIGRDDITVVYTYDPLNGDLTRKVGAGTAEPIVNNNTTVGILVSCPTGACFTLRNDSPQVIQLGLRFAQRYSGGSTAFTGTVDLNNTIVLRGTY